MTVLYGKLKDVSRAAFDQLGTAVVISATQARPELEGDGLILTELVRIPMEGTDGEFETEDLDPGPVVVRIEGGVSHGQQWQIGIPMDGRWNLADLIGEQVEWEPIVVSRAEAAARDSREQADRSESEADRSERAADRVGSAERVLEAEATAVRAERDAEQHRADAEVQADRAESEADRAEGGASDAATSAGESAGSAGAAASSASAAAGSAKDAAGSAGAAAADREQTGKDRVQTGEDVKGSAGERERAESAADAADASAGAAASSASAADKTVRDAVAEVTATTKGHADRADAAAERAKGSQSAAKGSADAAAESAQAAADIALGDIPGATVDTRGLVVLAGDLAGTADAPCVPGLALSAPGASLSLRPGGEGWSNARNIAASRGESANSWSFDGEWLRPPAWLGKVTVTVDWCGRTPVMLRGERPDGTAVTISTVEGSEPETHRQITTVVDVAEYPRLAVAATWTAEDVDAGCLVSLLVRQMPAHKHTMSDLSDWPQVDSTLVKQDDDRLSDSRNPLSHRHKMTDITGLDDELNILSNGVQAARDHADSLLVMVNSEDDVGDESGVLYLVAEKDK
jgi:hypothetical protein